MENIIIGIVVGVILSFIAGICIYAIWDAEDNDKSESYWGLLIAYIAVMVLFSFFSIRCGVEKIKITYKLEGVQEYVDNPEKYKVTRIPSKLEVDYNNTDKK